jgi:short-subunit dehydrogenase/MoaA/NifB/PqqE/SkfB family radical SAM enzyme
MKKHMDPFSFKGKNILVTGAGGGLGSLLVKDLAETGSCLVVSSRSSEALNELSANLSKKSSIIPIPADLSLPGQAEALAEKAITETGYIDVLFNNAGIGYFALMEEATDKTIRYLFEVNTFSPMSLIKALLPQMKTRGSGRIINIVSCTGRVPVPSVGVYGGSKSALAVMTNTMRLELEPFGIDIINIYPGTIDTPFEENALRENKRPGLQPIDHFGTSSDIVSKNILASAAGPPGEVWLDRGARWLATASLDWPKLADRRLAPLRDRVVSYSPLKKPLEERRWRLLQLESSAACDLNCAVCPWRDACDKREKPRDMPHETWEALCPYLFEIQAIDFSGGGEPLLQPRLADWIGEAKSAECKAGFLTNGVLLTKQTSDRLIRTGIDWIAVSIFGATADTHEAVQKGSSFESVCSNLMTLASLKVGKMPKIIINFVLTPANVHQVEEIVKLAERLGVNQVNFKQRDIVKGQKINEYGLFASKETRELRRLKKILSKARRSANKLKIDTTVFSFTPDEQPVCEQDPRNSFFIRHEGTVSPCINLGIGDSTFFLGRRATMPNVHYGHFPTQNLMELWETEICKFFRQRFQARVRAYDTTLARSSFEASWPKLQELLQTAKEAMPKAPEGCKVCHQLYDI